VEEYRLAAWIGLGKIQDPGAEGVQRNLKLARHAIDTLGMLEHKTRGNLAADEERYLRQALTDLRMNYMDELKDEESGTGTTAEPVGDSSVGPERAPAEEGGGAKGAEETDSPVDPSRAAGEPSLPDGT
jgi:hypothetical protein